MARRLLFDDEMIHPVRNERRYRQRVHHLDNYSDEELRSRFRFGRASINFIVDQIRDDIERQTKRNHAISTDIQVLVALRYYASGSFMQVIGDTFGLDKSAVSRIIRTASLALCGKLDNFVCPPAQHDIQETKRAFFEVAGFPGVTGCIDGTHVRIQGPSANENDFDNRKGFHSINVQCVCDSHGKFTNVVARWPGSTHDARMLRESTYGRQLERGGHNDMLLGDSGYPCRPFLMTPYLHPVNRAQEKFNAGHKSTRVVIERAFGVWKRRFHILHSEIRLSPERVCNVIGACAVLHNIAHLMKEPMGDQGADDDGNAHDVVRPEGAEDGRAIRAHITQEYFQE